MFSFSSNNNQSSPKFNVGNPFSNINNNTNNLFNNGGPFGNNTNNQSQGLFNNKSSSNPIDNIFNNKSNNQGGNIFNNNQGGSLFSNNQGGNIFSNNQGGNIFNNNQGGNIFNNNQGANQNNNNQGVNIFNNNQGNNNNILNYPINAFYTSIKPILTLNPNNSLKDAPVHTLSQEIQMSLLNLKLRLKQQNLKLDELNRYSQRLVELLEQSEKSQDKYKQLNNYINQKLNHCEGITNQIQENFDFLSSSFEEENKNIYLMEKANKYNIEVPSKFLIIFSQNLYNKTIHFQEKLNDIITLIKLYFTQNNSNFALDNDLMESTMAEFLKISKDLLVTSLKQEKMIFELVTIFLKFANSKGDNIDNVVKNIFQFDIDNEYKNKFLNKII